MGAVSLHLPKQEALCCNGHCTNLYVIFHACGTRSRTYRPADSQACGSAVTPETIVCFLGFSMLPTWPNVSSQACCTPASSLTHAPSRCLAHPLTPLHALARPRTFSGTGLRADALHELAPAAMALDPRTFSGSRKLSSSAHRTLFQARGNSLAPLPHLLSGSRQLSSFAHRTFFRLVAIL